MAHPLVTQLHFARSEFVRCLQDTPPEDAASRLGQMNCLSWIVGHLAAQEQWLWVMHAQGKILFPDLYLKVGYGQPPSTPDWAEMWQVWRTITAAADSYLDMLDPELLRAHLELKGIILEESVGVSLLRNIYHYWFHLGEAHAIRQMLGHQRLPDFVGNMAMVSYGEEG